LVDYQQLANAIRNEVDNLILQSDTACVKSPPTARPSSWQSTSFSHLVKYKSSCTYFARFRVGGKLIRRSLKTQSLSVAKLRLTDLEGAERRANESSAALKSGRLLMGDVLNLFNSRSAENAHIKPSTRKYHEEVIKALLKTWPGLEGIDVRQITAQGCIAWAAKVAGRYSPVRHNAMVGVLRQLLNLAVDAGAIYQNPAAKVQKARIRATTLALPSREQFTRFLATIRGAGGRDSRNCADLVSFLAFGGFRKGEAANVTWADCNLQTRTITVRGDEKTGTKNWGTRAVPMTTSMVDLLERLQAERGRGSKEGPVMQVRECQKAMDRAARLVGMERITHHDLRHFFATNCIESGVDIPTVSRWLGHKDGGALAMKVYGHLRDQHSSEMARKVSFS